MRTISSITPVDFRTKSDPHLMIASLNSATSLLEVNMITGTFESWRIMAQALGPLIFGIPISSATRSWSSGAV
mgnify:FL=1